MSRSLYAFTSWYLFRFLTLPFRPPTFLYMAESPFLWVGICRYIKDSMRRNCSGLQKTPPPWHWMWFRTSLGPIEVGAMCACASLFILFPMSVHACALRQREKCLLYTRITDLLHTLHEKVKWTHTDTHTQGDPIQPVKVSTDTETFHLGRREMKDHTSSFYSHAVSIHNLYSCHHVSLFSLVFLFFSCHRLSFFLPFSEDLRFLSSKVSGGRKFTWFIIFLL